MNSQHPIARVRAVKAAYEKMLLSKPNVVGVGVGLRRRGGQLTDQVCIVVSVRVKVPRDQLDPADRIPAELEGIPVDVQAVGEFRAAKKGA